MCSKAACGRQAIGCGLPHSWSRLRATSTSGPSTTTAISRTFLQCRTRSQTRSLSVAPAIDDAERRRAMRTAPESLDVWAAYQRGLWHLSTATPDDNDIAQDLFKQAIDLDPTFAGCYSALALVQLQSAALYQRLDPTEAQRSAEGLARQAVALDGADAQARTCLGWALQARGELEGALVEI